MQLQENPVLEHPEVHLWKLKMSGAGYGRETRPVFIQIELQAVGDLQLRYHRVLSARIENRKPQV